MEFFPDFNDFYKNNRNEINKFVEIAAMRYSRIMDPDDLKQEILYRLIKHNFLANWNKELSSINTYLTTKIRGYALHTVTAHLRSKNERRINEEERRIRNSMGDRIKKDSSAEFIQIEDVEFDDNLTGSFATEDIDLYTKEIIALFKDKVSPIEASIFDMYYWQGMSFKDIQECLNKDLDTSSINYTLVLRKSITASTAMKKILAKEGTYVE